MPVEAFNPYPGLRPFEPEEDHLFFGREREVDELLRRLRFNRFLSIIGTSGCGKSSLIRCGLISSLHGGMMVRAGSSWRVSLLRPGEDPIGHLAAALDAPEVIGATNHELASTSRVLIEAALRRGPRGLVEAVRHAHIPRDDNLLVVVDQFEELFRFQRSRRAAGARDEAVSFVKLLLEACNQADVPIYVVITMRSDFIGDCMEYPGLPEALNASQYLVPRMSRDALRSAITGPAAVAGGQIAPRLVRRLLNDLGTDQDQLPVLQHALMRTWDHWSARSQPGPAVDIDDYEAVGTLQRALSLHAEEAYAETGDDQGRRVAERIFKALTDTVTDPRGTRRPCSVGELAALSETSQEEVIRAVDTFRRPGRSFLMPPADVPLDPQAIVDISHESLMRNWTRLIGWADEERLSATVYLRVAEAAALFEEGSAGLWRDPELEIGLRWRRETRPTAAWAARYGEPFERAMRFLDRSEEERNRVAAERRAEKRRQWRQLQWTAALLAVLLLMTGTMAVLTMRASERAVENLRLARAAVDESLAVAERDPSELAADSPDLVRFREQLLERAQQFYDEFVKQSPTNRELRAELASANLSLAHIDRVLRSRAAAADAYREAIAQFESLVDEAPLPEYRRGLASAYNWLGETLRLSGGPFEEAREAYDDALALQEALARESAAQAEYVRDLARTRYNRGILLYERLELLTDDSERWEATFREAEADFNAAAALLEPLVRDDTNRAAMQELARVYNNTGTLLASSDARWQDALEPYTRAVEIHERLSGHEPANRAYAIELAKFSNNLADLLRSLGHLDMAMARNHQALAIVEDLARPAPSLSIEQADTHNLRGQILQGTNPALALASYRQAVDIFAVVGGQERSTELPEFHERFGDLLANLADWASERPGGDAAATVLSDAVTVYLELARRSAASGTPGEARSVLETLDRVVPLLTGDPRARADATLQELEQGLRSIAADETSVRLTRGENQ
jgi:tetratricopeptide (TPR) repeat protein